MSNFVENFKADILNNTIYEDENLLALNKKSGIPVQDGSKVQYSIDSVLNYQSFKYKLVHRLDKDTSGILLLAKNYETSEFIASQFQQKTILKQYIVIINGKMPAKSGTIKSFIEKRVVGGEEIMLSNSSHGKQAITEYKVVKTHNKFSMLEIYPKTGRKHQIRAQLKMLHCAILGDKKYGNKELNKNLRCKLHLHAQSITFEAPNFKKSLTLCAPIPQYMQKNIDILF